MCIFLTVNIKYCIQSSEMQKGYTQSTLYYRTYSTIQCTRMYSTSGQQHECQYCTLQVYSITLQYTVLSVLYTYVQYTALPWTTKTSFRSPCTRTDCTILYSECQVSCTFYLSTTVTERKKVHET